MSAPAESTGSALETALAEMLTKASETATAASAFLQDEMPQVVQQLLIWNACVSFGWMLFWLGVLFFVVRLMRRTLWKPLNETDMARRAELVEKTYCRRTSSEDNELGLLQLRDGPMAKCVLGGFPVILLIVIAMLNTAWLKILIAPKVYLIEYAASLTRGVVG